MSENYLYMKSNLEGMNNDELIAFMYQEIIKILNRTEHYFKINDIEQRVTAINKAIEIISGLMSVLDDKGGELTVKFRSLYLYSIQQLTTANFEMNVERIRPVQKIFNELQEAWKEKIKQDKKDAAPVQNNSVSPVSEDSAARPTMQGLDFYG